MSVVSSLWHWIVNAVTFPLQLWRGTDNCVRMSYWVNRRGNIVQSRCEEYAHRTHHTAAIIALLLYIALVALAAYCVWQIIRHRRWMAAARPCQHCGVLTHDYPAVERYTCKKHLACCPDCNSMHWRHRGARNPKLLTRKKFMAEVETLKMLLGATISITMLYGVLNLIDH